MKSEEARWLFFPGSKSDLIIKRGGKLRVFCLAYSFFSVTYDLEWSEERGGGEDEQS